MRWKKRRKLRLQSGWINGRGKEGNIEKYQLKPQDSWGHADFVSRLRTRAGAGELVVRNIVPKSTLWLCRMKSQSQWNHGEKEFLLIYKFILHCTKATDQQPQAYIKYQLWHLIAHVEAYTCPNCLGLTYVEGIDKIWQEILDLRVLSVCVPWAWGQEVKKGNGRAKKCCKIKVKELNSALNSFSMLHSFWTTQENLQTED